MASRSGAAGAISSTGAAVRIQARLGARSGSGLAAALPGLGQLDVGDGPFRRVARDGGIVADGGQPAGIDAFDRLRQALTG